MSHIRSFKFALGGVLLTLLSATVGMSQEAISIKLQQSASGRTIVVVDAIPEYVQARIEKSASSKRLADLLAVYVHESAVYVHESIDAQQPKQKLPPVLGKHAFEDGKLTFTPRFSLRRGVTYRVTLTLPSDGDASNNKKVKTIERLVRLEDVAKTPPPHVLEVYPTATNVPENLLRLYVHFSAPMRQGDAYTQVQLLHSSGEVVADPFVNVGRELWDPSGRRLTLLFDPGRIKRGLRPREELGPVLIEGESYTVVINASWTDGDGKPLVKEFRRRYTALSPDDVQPVPLRWDIEAPSAGSKQPLTVQFGESLDHAMLQRVIQVHRKGGESVEGDVQVSEHETRWQFVPKQPWPAGKFEIVVETLLEDLAGNSIARLFEVDVFEKVERRTPAKHIRLPLKVD